MQEMKYSFTRLHKPEILARGFHKGYNYFVVNYGTHPCAYVVIAKGQPYYSTVGSHNVKIECHGGCTFLEWGYRGIIEDSYKVIGWDYSHLGDFFGSYLSDAGFGRSLRRWTTEEMVEDCIHAIEQLYVLEHRELYYK